MREKQLLKKILTVMFGLWLAGAMGIMPHTCFKVQAAEEEEEDQRIQTELLREMELEKVQSLVDQLLGTDSFSFRESLEKLLKGEKPVSKEEVTEFVRGLFFSGLSEEKELFAKILV